jgi:hypothetical protein
MALKVKSYFIILFLNITLLFMPISFGAEQSFEAKQLRLAYTVNFFKHITWPDEKDKKKFQLAVYKDQRSVNFLTKALKSKKIKNKSISVSLVNNIEDLRYADSVFVPKKFNGKINNIANALRGSHTLLISNNSSNKRDVMINLIEDSDQSAISFEVNKPNIIYEKLLISTDLLLLGGSELDIATLYREMEIEVQQSKSQSIELQKELVKQENKLKLLSKQLKNTKQALEQLNRELSQNTKVAQTQKTELAKLQSNLLLKYQELIEERLILNKVTKQYQKIEKQLSTQQSILENKTQKNQEILNIVEQNKMLLQRQETELSQQNKQLKVQETDISDKKEVIDNQQTYLI